MKLNKTYNVKRYVNAGWLKLRLALGFREKKPMRPKGKLPYTGMVVEEDGRIFHCDRFSPMIIDIINKYARD